MDMLFFVNCFCTRQCGQLYWHRLHRNKIEGEDCNKHSLQQNFLANFILYECSFIG